MKKILLIPDSFKGSMQSEEICKILRERIQLQDSAVEIISIPVADGGEGSVDSFLAAVGGKKVRVCVKGPYMEEINSFYGLIDEGKTAVIEMAAAAGLPMVGENLHAERTTTYGVGQLILHAAQQGATKIIMGLGGSCTNDFGTGAAAACGVKFFREDGSAFLPVGGTLSEIHKVDISGLVPALAQVEFVTMCDIDNPLFGPQGAAYIFGPQKGADEPMVAFLDKQLRMVSETVKRELGQDVSEMPGAGAAGGMGGGMVVFFNSRLQMGIETVLEAVHFDRLLEGADFVITGEGKIDRQSLGGKVVIGVARHTKPRGVFLIALVGAAEPDIDELAHQAGVGAIFSINKDFTDLETAKKRAKDNLAYTADHIIRLMKQAETVR